jgi:hypothetical protein
MIGQGATAADAGYYLLATWGQIMWIAAVVVAGMIAIAALDWLGASHNMLTGAFVLTMAILALGRKKKA